MQVEWRQIREFPNYSVSNSGYVRNDDTGRIMAASVNQHGVVHVGLMRGPRQHKKSLALIVAEAFVERPNEAFDTPIHLDGNRHNNDTSNLLWRPLWFARKFNRQFAPGIRACLGRPVEIIAALAARLGAAASSYTPTGNGLGLDSSVLAALPVRHCSKRPWSRLMRPVYQ